MSKEYIIAVDDEFVSHFDSKKVKFTRERSNARLFSVKPTTHVKILRKQLPDAMVEIQDRMIRHTVAKKNPAVRRKYLGAKSVRRLHEELRNDAESKKYSKTVMWDQIGKKNIIFDGKNYFSGGRIVVWRYADEKEALNFLKSNAYKMEE